MRQATALNTRQNKLAAASNLATAKRLAAETSELFRQLDCVWHAIQCQLDWAARQSPKTLKQFKAEIGRQIAHMNHSTTCLIQMSASLSLVVSLDYTADRKNANAINKSPQFREWMMERGGFKCAHCTSARDLTLDHIISVERGGASTPDNIQVLCRSCNSKKG